MLVTSLPPFHHIPSGFCMFLFFRTVRSRNVGIRPNLYIPRRICLKESFKEMHHADIVWYSESETCSPENNLNCTWQRSYKFADPWQALSRHSHRKVYFFIELTARNRRFIPFFSSQVLGPIYESLFPDVWVGLIPQALECTREIPPFFAPWRKSRLLPLLEDSLRNSWLLTFSLSCYICS